MKTKSSMEEVGPPRKKSKSLKEKSINEKKPLENGSQKGSRFIKSGKTDGPTHLKKAKPKKLLTKGKGNFDKSNTNLEKSEGPTHLKNAKPKKFLTKGKGNFDKSNNNQEKVEDWTEFKKKKKELKLKRKKSKESFPVIERAKKIGEELRRKTLKGGEVKRTQLINELHTLLKGKGHYPKFVLAHDTARLVQWLLKYSTNVVINQISKEIVPVTVDMLQSKYGIHCVKRLLKYGNSEIRSQVIDGMLGHAVKLASHAVSAPIVEYAYSTWASPIQKQYLIQEFYGDLYKNSKDINVKHVSDTYKNNVSLKAATLGATKANLMRILNKSLLDSGLVQSVLCQFLSECSEDESKEMITLLAPHIVVISNSKDGVRAAMHCIWQGSNKDKKVIIKALKEHITELSKHEHGHCAVITLLDCMDDTVLLHKIILVDILKNAKDLAVNEWGRKVLLWLVAPGDSTIFHPVFVNELNQGRETSSCKKPIELRRSEILGYSIKSLLDLVANDVQVWLSNASLATEMIAIIKAANATEGELEKVYNSIIEVIINPDWKIKEGDKEILGIEHAGMHMLLKKLAKHDKNTTEEHAIFGASLVKKLNDEILQVWLKLNRGCFLLVAVFENGSEKIQKKLKSRLKTHQKVLEKQKTQGSKILLKKIS